MKDREREFILSEAADEQEHQRLMTLINRDREGAQRTIEGISAQA